MDRHVATGVSGALQQGFCWVLFYYMLGFKLPLLVWKRKQHFFFKLAERGFDQI
jgi:hypothetical protein